MAERVNGQTCVKRVSHGMFNSRPCGKRAKAERDGQWFCGTHDPVARTARSEARWEAGRDDREARQRAWRLQSAAPDLLAALKAMVASYDGLRDALTCQTVIGKLAAADAAIAKAEGRDAK